MYSPVKQTNDAPAAEVVAPAPVAREVKVKKKKKGERREEGWC